MEPTEHHAIAQDGTRLWWSSLGAGAPAVVLTDGIGCAGYIWKYLAPELAMERRVIHWNYRGHGRSDPPADPTRATLYDCVDDLLAVLAAAGERQAVLVGHSMGVQVAVEAQRRSPRSVAGLVLVCGAPGRLIDTFHDSPALRLAFPYARAFVERYPEIARGALQTLAPSEVAMQVALTFEVNRSLVHREDLVPYFADLARVDPGLFMRLLASASEHDPSAHLPRIDVPTLVVAGERDTFTPMRLSVRMHEAIPGSELLLLPEATHVAPLEDPERIAERVRAFLATRVRKRPSRRRTSTPATPATPAKPRPRRRAAGTRSR